MNKKFIEQQILALIVGCKFGAFHLAHLAFEIADFKVGLKREQELLEESYRALPGQEVIDLIDAIDHFRSQQDLQFAAIIASTLLLVLI